MYDNLFLKKALKMNDVYKYSVDFFRWFSVYGSTEKYLYQYSPRLSLRSIETTPHVYDTVLRQMRLCVNMGVAFSLYNMQLRYIAIIVCVKTWMQSRGIGMSPV